MHEELFSFPKERANPRTERTSFVEERHARREWEIFTRNVKFLSSVLQVDLRVFGTHFRSTCSPFRVFDCWVNRGDEALVRNGVNNHHVAGSLSVSPSRLGESSPLLRSNLANSVIDALERFARSRQIIPLVHPVGTTIRQLACTPIDSKRCLEFPFEFRKRRSLSRGVHPRAFVGRFRPAFRSRLQSSTQLVALAACKRISEFFGISLLLGG